jgi:hypothetical protein
MKAKFIQENVILSEHEGPYGLDPHDEWTGSVMEEYRKKYPENKIITYTGGKREIVNVGDWAQIFYILTEAKSES